MDSQWESRFSYSPWNHSVHRLFTTGQVHVCAWVIKFSDAYTHVYVCFSSILHPKSWFSLILSCCARTFSISSLSSCQCGMHHCFNMFFDSINTSEIEKTPIKYSGMNRSLGYVAQSNLNDSQGTSWPYRYRCSRTNGTAQGHHPTDELRPWPFPRVRLIICISSQHWRLLLSSVEEHLISKTLHKHSDPYRWRQSTGISWLMELSGETLLPTRREISSWVSCLCFR